MIDLPEALALRTADGECIPLPPSGLEALRQIVQAEQGYIIPASTIAVPIGEHTELLVGEPLYREMTYFTIEEDSTGV